MDWLNGLFFGNGIAGFIAQLIGICALVVIMLSYQMKTQKQIITMQIFSSLLFAIHFFMLGANTGGLLNIIACARSFVFANKDKKWGKSELWIPFFCGVCINAVIFTWTGIDSILPMLGMLFTTFSSSASSAKNVRRIAFPSSPLWIIYNVLHRSFAGVATETFVMISIIIAAIRLDFRKSKIK